MNLPRILSAAVLGAIVSLAPAPVGAADSPAEQTAVRETAAMPPPSEYAGLAGLTSNIATEAGEAFRGFFDPSPVRVRPFVHLGGMANASSTLGVMLADHLAAMLNGHANASYAGEGEGQRLEGVLQEVDGYLRIHALGTNGKGERRSHVAMVEMSTSLYRALHTYAETR